MKASLIAILKSVGLKVLTDWWENRGKDRVADFKDELIEYFEARIDLVEKQLKDEYGVREHAHDYILMKDNKTGDIYKLFISDKVIHNERYESNKT
jgi:hypothetical protein